MAAIAERCDGATWKHRRVSRSPRLRHWERDLRGPSDEQLDDRLAMAKRFETRSMSKGMGRNPKAAREWRVRSRQVEADIERRRSRTDA